jgi:hypothetical protein
MQKPMKFWPVSDRLEESDYDLDTAVAPISDGDTATPLALPVSIGDRIEIVYPEGADVPEAGTTEVYHFAGFTNDSVKLAEPEVHEKALERAEEGGMATLWTTISDGVWSFNERVQKHAAEVSIERVEVPRSYRTRY